MAHKLDHFGLVASQTHLVDFTKVDTGAFSEALIFEQLKDISKTQNNTENIDTNLNSHQQHFNGNGFCCLLDNGSMIAAVDTPQG